MCSAELSMKKVYNLGAWPRPHDGHILGAWPPPHGPLPLTLACWITFSMVLLLSDDHLFRERSGSVVECLTRDRGAAGLSLTGVTALWSLSKTHLS